jgi:hypothetical protein
MQRSRDEREEMTDVRLYLFPPSWRVLAIVALKNHLALDCEVKPIDLGCGDQLTLRLRVARLRRTKVKKLRLSTFGRCTSDTCRREDISEGLIPVP